MLLLLDFDRTLFDTDALYDFALRAHTIPEAHAATLKTAFAGKADYSSPEWQEFNAALARGDFQYVPENTAQFLFPDVLSFLEKHGSQSTIVTVGLPAIQQAKLDGAHIPPLVSDIVFAELRDKGDVLAERYPTPVEAIFVDDSVRQLASVSARCPWLTVYEIRRDGGAGDGRWPVIRSLTELEAVL